jgi:Uma2 family endonuclease
VNALLPSPDLTPHRVTVDELLALDMRGAFVGLPRLELLEGVLYELSPQKSPHVLAKNRLTFQLQNQILDLGLPYEALCEPTIAIGEHSAPEPDVVICKPSTGDGYFPADSILLIIEVSVTTLKTDMNFKKALYAGASIPEYWVFDVEGRQIHQFWEPTGEDFAQTRLVAVGESLASVTIGGLTVETGGLV